MKKIINRGTSSVWTSINPSNWCGDSFREFLNEKKRKNRISQIISLNRGTKSVLARDVPESGRKRIPMKSRIVLSCRRGTSTGILSGS